MVYVLGKQEGTSSKVSVASLVHMEEMCFSLILGNEVRVASLVNDSSVIIVVA